MRRGVRRVDDVGRLVGAGDPQRDPQVGVGPDVRADHAGRALRGQDQVHAERAAPAGDVDQPVDEVGQLRDHGRELVDDQHQPRHRLQVQLGPQPLGVPVVLDVLGPGVQQHLLAPLELGAERVERAHGQVAVEVADHADGMRQPGAVLERAAALVVDEDERHRVRPVGHAEHGDDRLQQLGLAGAGGARHQAVRAVGGQVQDERPVGADADRHLGRPAALLPGHQHQVGVRVRHVDQVEQPGRVRDRGVGVVPADVADRRERPGHPVGPAHREPGRPAWPGRPARTARRDPGSGTAAPARARRRATPRSTRRARPARRGGCRSPARGCPRTGPRRIPPAARAPTRRCRPRRRRSAWRWRAAAACRGSGAAAAPRPARPGSSVPGRCSPPARPRRRDPRRRSRRLRSCPAGTRASRAVTSATSSVTRFAAESGSAPTSATQSSPPRGAQCGSQRTQFQCGPAAGSEASTTMDRSRGLCRTAAWATIQRASARDASTGPARPTTPSLASDIETGTQNDVGTAGGVDPGLLFRREQLDHRGPVEQADPHPQRVGIVGAALPQPPPGPGGGEQDLRRVHGVLAALFLVGRPGLLQLGFHLGQLRPCTRAACAGATRRAAWRRRASCPAP